MNTEAMRPQTLPHPRAQFIAVIDEIQRSIGLASPANQAPDDDDDDDEFAVELIVDETTFLLEHRLDDESNVKVDCRFGSIADIAAPDGLVRLLELNLALAESNGGVLGIEPLSHDVVYTFRAPLSTANATDVLATLIEVTELRKEWRSNWFMAQASETVSSDQSTGGLMRV
jgi:hypothetical protein